VLSVNISYGLLEVNVLGRTATSTSLVASTVNSAWLTVTSSGLTSPNMMFVLGNGIGLSAEL